MFLFEQRNAGLCCSTSLEAAEQKALRMRCIYSVAIPFAVAARGCKASAWSYQAESCVWLVAQELATVSVDKLPTKIFILNNQHLGMVVQWEDRFYKANRAHTYLGRRVRAVSTLLSLASVHLLLRWLC